MYFRSGFDMLCNVVQVTVVERTMVERSSGGDKQRMGGGK